MKRFVKLRYVKPCIAAGPPSRLAIAPRDRTVKKAARSPSDSQLSGLQLLHSVVLSAALRSLLAAEARSLHGLSCGRNSALLCSQSGAS